MFTYTVKEELSKELLSQLGVSQNGDLVSFDPEKGWTEKRAESYLKYGGLKVIGLGKKEAFSKVHKATDEDYRMVREMLGNPENFDVASELFFREALVMNSSRIDRQEDLATDKALQALADSINRERSRWNTQHDRSGGSLAKSYYAYIKNVKGVNWLAVRFYGDKKTLMPGQPDVTVERALITGMLDHVSIGFFGLRPTYDEDKNCWILDPVEGKEVTVYEISFVDLGAVQEARVEKSATKAKVKPKQILKMSTKSFQISGATYTVSAKAVEGGDPEIDTTALEGQVKRLADQGEAYKKASEEAQTELKEAKKSYVDNIRAKQAHESMNIRESLRDSEEDLYAKSLKWLTEKSEDLTEKYVEINPTNQVSNPAPAGENGTEPESITKSLGGF